MNYSQGNGIPGRDSLGDLQSRKFTILELLSGMNDSEVREIRDILNRRCPQQPLHNGVTEPSRAVNLDSRPPRVLNADIKARRTDSTPPQRLPALLPTPVGAAVRPSPVDSEHSSALNDSSKRWKALNVVKCTPHRLSDLPPTPVGVAVRTRPVDSYHWSALNNISKGRKTMNVGKNPLSAPNTIDNKPPSLMDLPTQSSPREPLKMKRKQPVGEGEDENFKKLCEVVGPTVSLNALRNLTSPDDVRAQIIKLKKTFGVSDQSNTVTNVTYWAKVKDDDKVSVFLKAFASSLDREQIKSIISATPSEDEPVKKKKKKKEKNEKIQEKSNDNKIPDEVYTQYRKLISLRKQRCLTRPKLRLTPLGEKSSLTVADGSRVPLGLSQIQHLILFAILRDGSPGHCPASFELRKPGNLKKTLFLVVDGVSLRDYQSHRDDLGHLSSMPLQLEVAMPSRCSDPDESGNALTDISTLPLTEGEVKRLHSKYGTMEKAMQLLESLLLLGSIFPIKRKEKKEKNKSGDEDVKNKEDRFPRTDLLLSPWQMVENGYPVSTDSRFSQFRYTKDSYRPVTPQSPIWALDCEMCLTRAGQELTRVSIVNEQMEVLYDSLVKPPNPIINYLTQYSGITPAMMKNVTTPLQVIQEDIRRMLPSDCILAGQSLNCDLIALKLMHPYIIDTSVVFNLTGNARIKPKLKTLSAELLSERIQAGGISGHDPTEDAAACMKLILKKLSKSICWGNVVLGGQRSDEEIVAAQTLLLERDREGKPKKGLKLAEGAIIRKSCETTDSTDDVSPDYKQPPPGLATSPTNDVAWFFFQPLIQRKAPCLIVGDQLVVDHFTSIAPRTKKSSLVFQTVEDATSCVTVGRDEAPSLGLSLMYVSLADCDVVASRVEKLDGLVKKVRKKLEPGVVLTVLLAGRRTGADECRDGAAFLDLILEEIPPVSIPDVQST